MKRHPTTQQITWFIDLDSTKNLDLDPPYQRKSVWTSKDRTYFLDTIFNNYPCPAIFLHNETDDNGKTTYHVVDGKQRLQTILMFSKNEISIAKDFGDNNFDGKKFNELSTNQKKLFWEYILVVDTVDFSDQTQINQVFDRLNRNQKNLNDQELRHAKFRGWFINESEKESENLFWERVQISTKSKSKRMKDVQFISELLMIIIEQKIRGFDHDRITDIYAKYDSLTDIEFDEDNYIAEKERVRKYVDDMENTTKIITKWVTTVNNFYSLWALIALHKPNITPIDLSKKYDVFMQKVKSMTNETDPKKLTGLDQHAYTYFNNSRGASTDHKQRTGRLDALHKALLN